jgi:glycylpeptide N-tetradecanoyltransferase
LLNKEELKAVFDFLTENYIEDVDGPFRPHYSIEAIEWMLFSPDAIGKWHLIMVEKESKKIKGFIAATPTKINIKGKVVKSAIVNFLCIEKSLKSKRFAPVLMSELKRRINSRGIAQAIYSSRKVTPTPMLQTSFFHRIIDVKTLLDTGFITLPAKMTLKTLEKMHTLHPISVPFFRVYRKKDKKAVADLLNAANSKFEISQVFDESSAYMITPQKNVLQSFVVEENSKITDFMSYYILPAAVQAKDSKVKEIKIAYLYYYAATKVGFEAMLKQVLLCAQKDGCALFTATGTKGIEDSLMREQFNEGTDYTNFYLYNWKTASILPTKFGLVLP